MSQQVGISNGTTTDYSNDLDISGIRQVGGGQSQNATDDAQVTDEITGVLSHQNRQLLPTQAAQSGASNSSNSLSQRSGSLDKRQVVAPGPKTKPTKSRWLRARDHWSGRWFRKGSPWLSTALLVAGTVLCFVPPGAGAAAGGPLITAGLILGASQRAVNMVDLVAEHHHDKKLGNNPSGKALATKLVLNTALLGLYAVPLVGHFASLPGSFGHFLDAAAKPIGHAQDLGVKAFNWDAVGKVAGTLRPLAASFGGPLGANYLAKVTSHKARKSERLVTPIAGEFNCVDPFTGPSEQISDMDFMNRMEAVGNVRTLVDPSGIYKQKKATETNPFPINVPVQKQLKFQVDHMYQNDQYSVGLCGLIREMSRDRDNGDLVPGSEAFDIAAESKGTTSGVRALKERLYADAKKEIEKKNAQDDGDGKLDETGMAKAIHDEYRARLENTQEQARKWQEKLRNGQRDLGYEKALELYDALPAEYKGLAPKKERDAKSTPPAANTRIAYDGGLVDRELGNRSALIVDTSGSMKGVGGQEKGTMVFHSVTGMGAVLPEEEADGMVFTQTQRGFRAHAGLGGKDYEVLAKQSAHLQELASNALHEHTFAVTGTSQGGGKAAWICAKNDVPTFVTDPQELHARNLKKCGDYQETWRNRLVAIGSQGEYLQDKRLLKSTFDLVRYPNYYQFQMPPSEQQRLARKREASASLALHGQADDMLSDQSFWRVEKDKETQKAQYCQYTYDYDEGAWQVTKTLDIDPPKPKKEKVSKVPIGNFEVWDPSKVRNLQGDLKDSLENLRQQRFRRDRNKITQKIKNAALFVSTSQSSAAKDTIHIDDGVHPAKVRQDALDEVRRHLGTTHIADPKLRLALLNALSFLSETTANNFDNDLVDFDIHHFVKLARFINSRKSGSGLAFQAKDADRINHLCDELYSKGYEGKTIAEVANMAVSDFNKSLYFNSYDHQAAEAEIDEDAQYKQNYEFIARQLSLPPSDGGNQMQAQSAGNNAMGNNVTEEESNETS